MLVSDVPRRDQREMAATDFASVLRGSEPKSSGSGHRSVPIGETWHRVKSHLDRIGVTRIADITGLDRLGIPVYQAVMPRSADTISTYAGKGPTADAARVSAALEAVERYCACLPPPVSMIASQQELTRNGVPFLPPADLSIELLPGFDADSEIGWCWGYDLIGETPLLVSSEQAGTAEATIGAPVSPISTTNGIASGNTVREAVLHGLYEVIERDSWTIAHVIGQALPALAERAGVSDADPGVLYPLAHNSLPDELAGLAARFDNNGVRLQLFSVASALGVPTVVAISTESGTRSARHVGLGTDADPAVAVMRAITEVAQSRAGDIAGGREDMTQAEEDVPRWMLHTQRSTDSTLWRGSRASVTFDDLGGYATEDVAADLAATVERVRCAGLDRIIVVDLSEPELPFPVCRVLVPGAESWAADHSLTGPRLVAAWNSAVARLIVS